MTKINEFIIPYRHIDGVPTLRDSDIASLYHLMERDGTLDTVFYDAKVDIPMFVEFMTRQVKLYVYYCRRQQGDRSVALAAAWLSHFEQDMARTHFCFFKESWGEEAIRIGQVFSEYLKGANNLSMLMGWTPRWNRLALKFIQKIGWKISGIIPYGSTDKTGSVCPTIISYYE